MVKEMQVAQNLIHQRMIYSIGIALLFLIPAIYLYLLPGVSIKRSSYCLLFWTFSFVSYLVVDPHAAHGCPTLHHTHFLSHRNHEFITLDCHRIASDAYTRIAERLAGLDVEFPVVPGTPEDFAFALIGNLIRTV